MKTIYKIFSCLIIMLLATSKLFGAWKPTNAEPSVLRIIAISTDSISHGTGFFVNSDGYIVTNAHVVEENGYFLQNFIVLQNYENKTYMYKAKLVGTPSIDKDLAIIKINSDIAMPLYFPAKEPEKNAEVFGVGFSGFNDGRNDTIDFISECTNFKGTDEVTELMSAKEKLIEKFLQANSLMKDIEKSYKEEPTEEKKEHYSKLAEAANTFKSQIEDIWKEVQENIDEQINKLADKTIIPKKFASFAEPAIQKGNIEKIKTNENWGLNREGVVKVIQHNAPIRTGNSGGPLLDSKGCIIAVNTVLQTQNESEVVQAQLSTSSHYDEIIEYLELNNITFTTAQIVPATNAIYISAAILALILLALIAYKLLRPKKNVNNKELQYNDNYTRKISPVQFEGNTAIIKLEFTDINAKKYNISIDSNYLKNENNYIVIGRSKEFADVCFDNTSISGQHLGLRCAKSQLFITDRNSTNSTYVDGQRLTPFKPMLITSKTQIKIGELTGYIYYQQ